MKAEQKSQEMDYERMVINGCDFRYGESNGHYSVLCGSGCHQRTRPGLISIVLWAIKTLPPRSTNVLILVC